MFRPADAAWLTDCWDSWETGAPHHAGNPILLTGEAWRLSHGFVGCNLVIDLIEEQRYLTAMGSMGYFSPEYAPGLTCDELADWLHSWPAPVAQTYWEMLAPSTRQRVGALTPRPRRPRLCPGAERLTLKQMVELWPEYFVQLLQNRGH